MRRAADFHPAEGGLAHARVPGGRPQHEQPGRGRDGGQAAEHPDAPTLGQHEGGQRAEQGEAGVAPREPHVRNEDEGGAQGAHQTSERGERDQASDERGRGAGRTGARTRQRHDGRQRQHDRRQQEQRGHGSAEGEGVETDCDPHGESATRRCEPRARDEEHDRKGMARLTRRKASSGPGAHATEEERDGDQQGPRGEGRSVGGCQGAAGEQLCRHDPRAGYEHGAERGPHRPSRSWVTFRRVSYTPSDHSFSISPRSTSVQTVLAPSFT